MTQPRALIITAPGTNRDADIAFALAHAGAQPEIVPLIALREQPQVLRGAQLIVIPGGFSYADALGAGRIFAWELRQIVGEGISECAQRGVPVLGICNGFQILAEAGLVPGVLLPNASLTFVCRDVHLRVERNDTAFARRYAASAVLRVPVAHHDGNYFADPDTLDRLEGEGQVALRYCRPDGVLDAAANPNGSARHIAGVYNARRNVLGLMPHPENAIDARLGSTDGRGLFDGLVEAVAR